MSFPTALDVEIEDEYAELQQRSRLIGKDAEVSEVLAAPMNMTVRNGDVIIYHTAEHDARIVPGGDATKAALRKTLPDGSRAFSARPTGEVVLGQVKCYLHPDHPDRKKWYDLGITIMCQSGHFASIVDMERQMETKHSREWLRMKSLNEREERDEDRAFQRQMLERMAGAQAQVTTSTPQGIWEPAPGQAEASAITPPWTEPAAGTTFPESEAFICGGCGKTFPTEHGRKVHQGREHKA